MLVTAASADFEAHVREEAGQWAGAALLASPHLVIVRNESPHTILRLYAVSFKSIRADGIWDFHHIEFKYPDAVGYRSRDRVDAARYREIRPSEQRLVSRYFEIDPGLDNSWLDQMIDMQKERAGGSRAARNSPSSRSQSMRAVRRTADSSAPMSLRWTRASCFYCNASRSFLTGQQRT